MSSERLMTVTFNLLTAKWHYEFRFVWTTSVQNSNILCYFKS